MSEDKQKKNKRPFDKFFDSIDNLLIVEKEQKLKLKLSREIRDSIFTDEVAVKLNENDLSGLIDEGEDIPTLFSNIFPIFVKKGDVVFRLYKHKVEVDLSDDMSDRYIYMFSDGRLTSGLFQCFNISDDEYLYGVKRIIDAIPLFKTAIINTIENFQKNINIHNDKMKNLKNREPLAEKNYNELLNYLSKSREN